LSRILVVDDEESMRQLLEIALGKDGHRITAAESGTKACELIDKGSFDLVISDIKMPDISGYEVFRAAKEDFPDTPVILMTGFGYDPHHSIVRASQEGLQSFLFKPFKAQQLLAEVAKALLPPAQRGTKKKKTTKKKISK